MFSLGYDIGSSSIKAAIMEIESGKMTACGFLPKDEMQINSPEQGFAEQYPTTWWKYVKLLTRQLISESNINGKEIRSIGISYQMHGLVPVDKDQNVIRPSIIWCDSRSVKIGNRAFEKIGKGFCLQHLLNSPGNFTPLN